MNGRGETSAYTLQKENYARWNSDRAMSGKNQAEQEALQMDAIADAADAMSDGAIVDGMIHG